MNQDQIEQYKRDGYVVARELFFSTRNQDFLSMLELWKGVSKKEYRKRARLIGMSWSVTSIFGSECLKDVALQLGIERPIFATQPAIHVMGVDEKWEGVGAHQDWPALQTGLNTVVCWVPLTDVGIDNYPVEFVPGSHLKGLLQAKPGAHYSEVDATGMEFVPVPANVGDVIFFNVFTVHRTRTPGWGTRLAVSHRFEDAGDPWYVEHGYSAQRRVIDRAIRYRPTVEQVQKVFE